MPTYDYKCSCGNEFEDFQSINSEPKSACPKCGKEAPRIMSSGSSLVFKGSGFYITDYKKTGSGDNGSTKTNGEKKEKKSEPKKDSDKS